MRYFVPLILIGLTQLAIAGPDTHAEQAVSEAAQASSHASGSAAHAIAASGQATSAIASIPLSATGVVLGTAGAVSVGAARGSARAASTPIGRPLPITDEAIIVMPPNEALKNPKKSENHN